MRWLVRGVLVLGGLLVLVVAVFVFYFDRVVGASIEAGCEAAMGVDTRVGWVRAGILTGTFQTGTLRIGNPPGFETPQFLRLRRGHFDVSLASLRQRVIEVPLFELGGVDISLETASGKTNYGVILENIRRFQRELASGAPSDAESESGGRELLVRELVVRDITATIDAGVESGTADRVVVEIPEIRMHGVGTAGAGGMPISKLSETVVRGILIAVAKKAPMSVARGLLSGAGSLGNVALEVPGALLGSGATDAAKKLGGEAGDAARKVEEGAKKALGRLGGALRRD